jgi:SAM-dependent methyltransferase
VTAAVSPNALGLEAIACPLDRSSLHVVDDVVVCGDCGGAFPYVDVEGVQRLDLRALDHRQHVQLGFALPPVPPAQVTTRRAALARGTYRELPTREQIRRRFGTKLQRAAMRHIADFASHDGAAELPVLDLGCGGGGNRYALELLGMPHVTAVDMWSPAADYLADAHRLPFRTDTFGVVLATATVEHFVNPFVAFREIARVLLPGGLLIATASFWESWHDSYFHASPGGLAALCQDSGLTLTDLWSGWGFIASIGAHALGMAGHKRALYRAQGVFDMALRVLGGGTRASAHRLRTSGSFGLRARKPEPKPT